MNKQKIIQTIQLEKAYLNQKFGVEEIALFGSYSRDEQLSNSDIDLLVKMKSPSFSLLVDLHDYLQKKLGCSVDITRKGPHLSQRFLGFIQNELIYA